jgi:hypothetical protein
MAESFLGDVSEVFGILQQGAGIYTTLNPPSAPAKPPASTAPPPSRTDPNPRGTTGAMVAVVAVAAVVFIAGFFAVRAIK